MLKMIDGDDRWLAAMLAGAAFISKLRLQTSLVHEFGDSVGGASLAQAQQIVMDLAVAINAAALQPGLFDQPG